MKDGRSNFRLYSNGKRLPAWLVTLLAPALVYLICRNAALSLSGPIALAAGANLPPANFSAVTKALARTSQLPRQKVTPEMLTVLGPALLATPLASESFVIAASAADKSGQMARALALMEEARRRRPTQVATRAQLALYYGKTGNAPAMLREVDWLLRRSGRTQELLLPEMVKVLPDPAGRAALAQMLAKSPPWREKFYRVAASTTVAPEHASALVEAVRSHRNGGADEVESLFEMQAFLAANRYRAARGIWERIWGSEAADDNLVFDGSFRGSRAAAPFNWVFRQVDVGRASVGGGKGVPSHLEIEYFGGKDTMLAEQLLTLKPGPYELRLGASSESPPKSADMAWRLACLPRGTEIGRLDLRNLTPKARILTMTFVVPSGCEGQSLQLMAEAGDYSGTSSIAVSNLSVRPRTR
jgi:hypothetical protein